MHIFLKRLEFISIFCDIRLFRNPLECSHFMRVTVLMVFPFFQQRTINQFTSSDRNINYWTPEWQRAEEVPSDRGPSNRDSCFFWMRIILYSKIFVLRISLSKPTILNSNATTKILRINLRTFALWLTRFNLKYWVPMWSC